MDAQRPPDQIAGLPEDLWQAANECISHRDELYTLGCRFGRWFCRNGYSEEECADWLIDQSPLRGNYTARQFEYQLRRAVTFAYESYDPRLGLGPRQDTADPEDLTDLLVKVRAAKIKRDKRYWTGLVQHAINHGVNPVYCTPRQLAAASGYTSSTAWVKAAEAMKRMERLVNPDGVLTRVDNPSSGRGSRLYYLNPEVEIGYINTMHDTYVPVSESEVEAKRLRAERRQARLAERERYSREHELHMRYITWEAQRQLADLSVRREPAPDPFV